MTVVVVRRNESFGIHKSRGPAAVPRAVAIRDTRTRSQGTGCRGFSIADEERSHHWPTRRKQGHVSRGVLCCLLLTLVRTTTLRSQHATSRNDPPAAGASGQWHQCLSGGQGGAAAIRQPCGQRATEWGIWELKWRKC